MALSDEKIVALILRDRNEILAYVNGFLNDGHLAEDCLQEVSSAALDRRNSFENETHVIGWALRVARNKAVDLARKRQRQPRTLPVDVLELIEEQWAADLAARSVEPSKELEYLDQCVKTLSANARKLVEMRYFEGLSSSHIASALEKKVETVYQALARAHVALRACVERKLASNTAQKGGASPV
jgi:RNA polymerase sigma-70 factor (ECF subfamily)